LLDELLDVRTLHAAPDFVAMRAELLERLAEVTGDVERQMDVMRHFKHAYIFRFAVQDINGELQLETISDYLSALADLILSVALEIIWPNVRGRHLDVPKFAVIGYGKLGGKELGYASDLDIIFLYDDESPEASEVYARFAQRINNWFNSLTSAGLLYETDLQLRPDGNSGLLVSRVDAFRDYQLNKAWIWEHQALTRARFVAGDRAIAQTFDEIRVEVMTQARDATILNAEVLAMREKMRKAQHTHEGMFDLKHGVGGIIDVEFLVQYLVLLHAPTHPELTVNIGNIGLLKCMSTLNIIDAALAESVANAYRTYRHMQHMLKLQGATQLNIKAESIAKEISQVNALWQQVFA
jgi:glutamate-ammonia-ligase adenylyltransferase